MRQLLVSTITLLIFSVTLTACNSGSSGGGSADGGGGAQPTTTPPTTTPPTTTPTAPITPPDPFGRSAITVIANNNLDPLATENVPATELLTYNTLGEIVTAANGGTAITGITLQGLSVTTAGIGTETLRPDTVDWDSKNDVKIEQTTTLSRLTSTAVDLTFNADGTVTATNIYGDVAYENLNLTADRKDIFGFATDSTYMTYLSWSDDKVVTPDATDATKRTFTEASAVMIAGVETAGADIPNTVNFAFEGKGKGVYDGVYGKRDTVFDIRADVNASAREITLAANNTVCFEYDCGVNANHLDFTGTLNYGENMNNASGDIAGGGGLSGKADARFYGAQALEFGGTFALYNTNSYYTGAFGGQNAAVHNYNRAEGITTTTAGATALDYKADVNNPTDIAVPTLAIATKADGTTQYESIDELFRAGPDLTVGDVKNLTLPAFGHHRYYQETYERNDTSIAWADSTLTNDVTIVRNLDSVVSLNLKVGTRDGNNRIFYDGGSTNSSKDETVTVYTSRFEKDENGIDQEITVQYAGNTGAETRTYFRGEVINVHPEYPSVVYTHRNDGGERSTDKLFGFTPKYMMGITWLRYAKTGFRDAADAAGENDAYAEVAYAQMITGFETGETFSGTTYGAIPTDVANNATFRGKGQAFYGYNRPTTTSTSISKRETLNFNVAANVDFGSHNVDFSIYNTCFHSTCTIKRTGLDFDASISFDDNGVAVNQMSKEVTTDNGLLAGTLDAKFYGNAVQEIGGAFTMNGIGDNNIYYYGTFASSSLNFNGSTNAFSLNVVPDEKSFEDYYNYPQAVNIPYQSLAVAADANEASRFILRGGVAVQRHDVANYIRDGKSTAWDSAGNVGKIREINFVNSETPAVALSFDANGKISGAEAYFGFNSYKATTLDGDGSGAIELENTNYADAENSNITVARNAFGFNADSMVYVGWEFDKATLDDTNSVIVDDIYNINGMMVAGIETLTMPTDYIVDVPFIGAGVGNYGNKNSNHALAFTANADVNFVARTVALAFSDTACVDADCGVASSTLNLFNFSTALAYTADSSSMTAVQTLEGGLTGNVDARFYGVGADSARELGGTFALINNTYQSYYYGAFGAFQGGAIVDNGREQTGFKTATIASPKAVNISHGTAPWLSLVLDAGNTITVQGPAAYGTSITTYNRDTGQDSWQKNDAYITSSATKLNGAAVTVKPDSLGRIGEVTLHLDGDNGTESYKIANTSSTISTVNFAKGFDTDDGEGYIAIDRRSNVFGFVAKDMYQVRWSVSKTALSNDENILTDTTYNKRGMILVGSETTIADVRHHADVPDSLVSFKGKGRGYYNGAAPDQKGTIFDITVNADLHNKTVGLSTGFMKTCTISYTNCVSNTTLNFMTAEPLSYAADVNGGDGNSISGAVISRTYSDSSLTVGNFTGTVDASFYGLEAKEFGGGFAMIDENYNAHYGIFGTKLQSSVFNNAYSALSETEVVRVGAGSGALEATDTQTYQRYDSFKSAQQDAKNQVKHNGIPNQKVHTPAVAAFREDTSRYQRITTAQGDAWAADDIIADTSYAGTIHGASSYIAYGAGAQNGGIYNVIAYGNKVGYELENANGTNSYHSHTEIESTSHGDNYHYFSGGNPIEYYKPSNEVPKPYGSNVESNLTVEKPTTFGFVAQYMAYIRWSVTKEESDIWKDSNSGEAYTIDGYMVSGFETEHNSVAGATDGDRRDDMPEIGTAEFVGAGMGTYHTESGKGYRTRFDSTATVDFALATVGLNLTGTKCVTGLGNCVDITTGDNGLLAGLNISNAMLTYTKGGNKILVDSVSTVGAVGGIAAMSGTVDARFYGQNRVGEGNQNAAKEFGGAFSFRDGDRSYIGIFGMQQEEPSYTASMVNTGTSVTVPNQSLSGLTSFSTITSEAAVTSLQAASIVQITKNSTNETIINDNISGGAIDYYYNGTSFAATSLTLYLADKKYDVTGGTNDGSTSIAGTTVTTNTGQAPVSLNLDRTGFGFTANYMARLDWKFAGTDYGTAGFGIAGFETAGNLIPVSASDNAMFKGKGKGRYSDIDDDIDTEFDMIANADFAARTVAVTGTHTSTGHAYLNFTGTLGYALSTNALTTDSANGGVAFTTTGDGDNASMSGTASARFYGATGAGELGGTFNLINDDAGYVGWFGAEMLGNHDVVVDNANITTALISAHTQTISPIATHATIDAANNSLATITMNALGVYANDNADYTLLADKAWGDMEHYNSDRTVKVARLAGAAASVTFTTNISTISLYLNDGSEKTYTTTDGTATLGNSLVGANITTGAPSDSETATVNLYRGAEANSIFDFTSSNIAYIEWHIKKDADVTTSNTGTSADGYDISGLMVTGVQTADANITNSGIGYFAGKGRGYVNLNGSTPSRKGIVFDITVNVNFANTSLTLASTNSMQCTNATFSSCNAGNDTYNFESDGAISYAGMGNNISGAIKASTSSSSFAGQADARFYGTDTNASTEFAGSFAMNDDDNNQYYGVFGAEKQGVFVVENSPAIEALTTAQLADGIWNDIVTTNGTPTHKLNGIGFYHNSDAPLRQTFEVKYNGTGSRQGITEVTVKKLDALGAESNMQDFTNPYFSAGTTPHINDGNSYQSVNNGTAAGSLRFSYKETNSGRRWVAVVHEPNQSPWDWKYQTVGIMDNSSAADSGGNSPRGGFSMGMVTDEVALPSDNNVAFTGRAYGYYKDATSEYLTRADVNLSVNFAAGSRTATITTSSTVKGLSPSRPGLGFDAGSSSGSQSFGSATADTTLDFTGTLTYDADYKWYRGAIAPTGTSTLSTGEAAMRAYGPAAEEVGGAFSLQNSDGTKRYAGGFGAKR